MADDNAGAGTGSVHTPGSDTPNQSSSSAPSSTSDAQSSPNTQGTAPIAGAASSSANAPVTSSATSNPPIAPGVESTPVDGPPRINAGATGRADPNDFGEAGKPEDPSPLSAAHLTR